MISRLFIAILGLALLAASILPVAEAAAVAPSSAASGNKTTPPTPAEIAAALTNMTRAPVGTPAGPQSPVLAYLASLPANATLKTGNGRISVIDGIASDLYYAYKEARGQCVYGYNCGSECGWRDNFPNQRPPKVVYYGAKKWKDNLDQACFNHDWCLAREQWDPTTTYCPGRPAGMTGRFCHCEYNLRNAAQAIYNREKRCSWWQLWCYESNKVAAAQAIVTAMNSRIYCGSC